MKEEVLRMDQIVVKSHNMRYLLNNFNLNLFKGEVLGLIGLYDSGKTTLLKLIGGELQADYGRIFIYDEDMSSKGSYLHRHVFMIHEQTMLSLSISVAENMFVIRNHRSKKLFVNKKEVLLQAQHVFDELSIKFSALTSVKELSMAQRHLVELAKAYIVGSKIILIDEIIAAYSENELQEFLNVIELLKGKGISFIIVGYSSKQISSFADRLVFLANGKNMKTLSRKDFGCFDINNLFLKNTEDLKSKAVNYVQPKVVFEIQNLQSHHLNEISFTINAGEIVCICVESNEARKELYSVLTSGSSGYTGKFLLNGQTFHPKNIIQSFRKGILFIPPHSIGINIIDNIYLIDNICLPIYPKMSVCGYIKKGMLGVITSQYSQDLHIEEKKFSEERADTFDIYTRQKVYLSRIELAQPKVLFCVNPYERADAVTCEQLDSFFGHLAKKGTAVGIIVANLKSTYDICDSVIMLIDWEKAKKLPKEEIKMYKGGDDAT